LAGFFCAVTALFPQTSRRAFAIAGKGVSGARPIASKLNKGDADRLGAAVQRVAQRDFPITGFVRP